MKIKSGTASKDGDRYGKFWEVTVGGGDTLNLTSWFKTTVYSANKNISTKKWNQTNYFLKKFPSMWPNNEFDQS